jgi:hypothetical protein
MPHVVPSDDIDPHERPVVPATYCDHYHANWCQMLSVESGMRDVRTASIPEAYQIGAHDLQGSHQADQLGTAPPSVAPGNQRFGNHRRQTVERVRWPRRSSALGDPAVLAAWAVGHKVLPAHFVDGLQLSALSVPYQPGRSRCWLVFPVQSGIL